jgi:hypothetical protein
MTHNSTLRYLFKINGNIMFTKKTDARMFIAPLLIIVKTGNRKQIPIARRTGKTKL